MHLQCTVKYQCHKASGRKKICPMLCVFPWVGAVTGGISYLVVLFADLLKEREISFGSLFFPAVLTVLPVLISGGIHMDGFLDTQDALSSWQSEEKRLEILKDPHAGAFAILSGCVYFILSLGIYSGVTEESMRLIGMGFILSRTLSGISVLRFPQARKNGLVAVFAERADKRRTFRVLIIYLVLEIVALLWAGRGAGLCCVIVAGLLFCIIIIWHVQNLAELPEIWQGIFCRSVNLELQWQR